MSEKTTQFSSLEIIAQYIAAIRSRNPVEMQALRDLDFVLDWVHADAFADQPLTHAQTNQFWPAWFTAFTEMDYEVTRTIAADRVVVVQWTFTGTHDRKLGSPIFDPPLAPTGKTIQIRGVSVFDMGDGKIKKETMYIDLATLWVELGISL